MTQTNPIIIGGGIAGLSAAYEFARAGQPVTLIEDRLRLGGVIETETVEGCVLEGGPDSFLAAKPAGLELIDELGLKSELISSNDHSRVTYIVRDGRLIAMPDGLMLMVPTKILPMAFSPLLSWGTKLRMGLEYFRRPPRPPLPDRSVADFIRDHYGAETVDYLADPLLTGVYGGSAETLSVGSVLTRFVELERKYGSLTRGVLAARRAAKGRQAGPLFQTLRGGLGSLVEAVVASIGAAMTVVRGRAETLEQTATGWRVRVGGDWLETARLVVATPAHAAGALLAGAAPELSGLLQQVEYTSSITLSIGYRRADCGAIPAGFGFLVPRCEQRRLVACTFTGAKFPCRVPEGLVVLRCFLGGAGNEAVFARSDEQLLEEVQGEIAALLGWRAAPRFTRIRRWERSMAQYGVGHAARLRQLEARRAALPGLQLAGNAYDGIGVPDCIRLGRAAARALLGGRDSSRVGL